MRLALILSVLALPAFAQDAAIPPLSGMRPEPSFVF